ncbi:hypothetical protein N656DRAFT_720692 [Canariomyces notabilis]|uniref:Uncharacterized protein n=1 Tax=Canariomyces notabilis TaxID=2074819 RepID=A0AAN6QBK0_9PEZI|nr:hypothetical protein N656DRAFT_720692 [Canariomyces arenarius]
MHGASCPKCGAASDGVSKSCDSCGAVCGLLFRSASLSLSFLSSQPPIRSCHFGFRPTQSSSSACLRETW